MQNDSQDISPVFRIDVTQSASEPQIETSQDNHQANMTMLLEQLVVGQDRQNELLEEIVEQMGAAQRQRSSELHNWKEANPLLARRCRAAAEALSQVQTEFLHNLTGEVQDNYENMLDGEFVMNEFVDRYGPRLAHLNGVLQLLSQLSGRPASDQ
jgi:predicted DsbA family dithiol-disulfide isomerase